MKLQASGTAIEQVVHQKLLGVTIDQELTFKEHVDKLCKKLSQKIGLLKKLRTYLPIDERRLFYNALIKPVMMYGSIVWTYCSNEDLKRVFRLQKRAARVILGAGTRSRTVENFKKLNWIPFYDEVKISKCVLVYKALHGESPTYITSSLTTNHSLHGRETRHGQYNLICPKFRNISEAGRSFQVSSVKLWNSLPNVLKKKPSTSSFKNALRNYFIDSYRGIDSFEVLL